MARSRSRSSLTSSEMLAPAGITALVLGGLGYLWYKGHIKAGDVAVVPVGAFPVNGLPPDLITALNQSGAQAGLTVTSATGDTVTGSVTALVQKDSPPQGLGVNATGNVTVPRKSVTSVWRAGKKVSS